MAILILLAYVVFLVIGWKETPRSLRHMALYLTPVLLASNLFFGWLRETRNYMPAVFVLSVIAARYISRQISRSGSSSVLPRLLGLNSGLTNSPANHRHARPKLIQQRSEMPMRSTGAPSLPKEGTIHASTAKFVFERPVHDSRKMKAARNKDVLQRNFFFREKPALVKSSTPSLPAEDNTPDGLQLLLRANQHYRQAPWPEPFNRTKHRVRVGDARDLSWIPDNSVHLVVTSPPYWTLKVYAPGNEHQMGHFEDYEHFLVELDRVWRECHRVLVGGGRICCVVGDVCLPRKKAGRHHVIPLHSDIQVRARALGLECLTPILWHKIANGATEVQGNGSGFYGKPYQPGHY